MIIHIKQILTEESLNYTDMLKDSNRLYQFNPMYNGMGHEITDHKKMTNAYDTMEGDSKYLGMIGGNGEHGGGHRFTMEQRRALMDGMNRLRGIPLYGSDTFKYSDRDLLDQYKKYETEQMLKKANEENLALSNKLISAENRRDIENTNTLDNQRLQQNKFDEMIQNQNNTINHQKQVIDNTYNQGNIKAAGAGLLGAGLAFGLANRYNRRR